MPALESVVIPIILLGLMIPVPGGTVPLSLYDSGTVAYYQDQDLMYQVTQNRKQWGQDFDLTGYVDGIALNDCSLLGKTVWIQRGDGPIIGPFLNVDCANGVHIESREERNVIADVGYYTAKHIWEANGYITDVKIYLETRMPSYYYKLERMEYDGCDRPYH